MLVALVALAGPSPSAAQDVHALDRLADEAAAKGLPAAPLINKIREGLAKGHDPKRIEAVVLQMTKSLETADRLLREIQPIPAAVGADAAVTLLGESIGSGVTPEEVRELHRVSMAGSAKPVAADTLASAAKGLAFVKEARLPVRDGTAVMAEAARQGFRSHEILDLGREVKRREADYRSGRASLLALRDAIARGERPDQLFTDDRASAVDRPAARPEPAVDRPAARPEAPRRPEQPVRPERPDTSGRAR